MLTFSDAPADSGADSAVLPPSEQANRPTEEPAEKPEILTRENGRHIGLIRMMHTESRHSILKRETQRQTD